MVGVSATRRCWLAMLAGHIRHCLRCRRGHFDARYSASEAGEGYCPIQGGCRADGWAAHCHRMKRSRAYEEASMYWTRHRCSPDLRRRAVAVIRREAKQHGRR